MPSGRVNTAAAVYGGILNSLGGVLGATATCACNQLLGNKGADTGDAMKCCAANAAGSFLGGLVGGALGRLKDPASAVVSRYDGSLLGEAAVNFWNFWGSSGGKSPCCH